MSYLEIASGWVYHVRRRPDGEFDLRPVGGEAIAARHRWRRYDPDGATPPAYPLRTQARQDGRLEVFEVAGGKKTWPAAEFANMVLYADGSRIRDVSYSDNRRPLFDSRTGEPL